MEAAARLRRILIAMAAVISIGISNADAANYRTQNFIIQASTQQLAQAVGHAAEKYRNDLAVHWLGEPLRPWPRPCPIRVRSGQHLAAQGVTTYNLQPVRDFQMEVVGSPQRILDSVLPHEITHTILATHFGRPLPRWADEGICTTVEHASERSKHEAKLREFLQSRRGIAMNRLFLLTEYPSDVLPMYAQGYSVCRFLIEQKGPRTFINFLHDYMDQRSWTQNVKKHYGYDSLAELQKFWLAWVAEGSGPVEKFAKVDSSRTRVAAASAIGPNRSREDLSQVALASGRSSLEGRRQQAVPSSRQRGNQNLGLAHADGRSVGGALNQSLEKGWYSRQRDSAQDALVSTNADATNAGALAGNVINPIVPPSVRDSGRYSVSQQQGEQRISRGGQQISPGGSVIERGGYDLRTMRRYR